MRTVISNCPNEKEEREHEILGIVPVKLLVPEDESGLLTKAIVCTGCGNIKEVEATRKEIERADTRYVECLFRHGLIEEKEKKELIGE